MSRLVVAPGAGRSHLLGTLVAVLILGGCGRSASQTVATPSATQAAVPAGEMRVNYGNASIVVPADWQTLLPGATACGLSATDNVVLLGNAAEGGPLCGSGHSQSPTSFAHLEAIPSPLPGGTSQTVNGQVAIRLAPTAGTLTSTYVFPRLGVELEATGAQAESIVASIGWSSRYLALHPHSPVTIPSDWGSATYADVTVRLPRSWPLTQVGPAEGEPGCGVDFFAPKLLEGPLFVHSCGLSAGLAPLVDGVWLQGQAGLTKAQVAAGGYAALGGIGVKVFIDDSEDPMGIDPVVHLLVVTPNGNVDGIDVGLGPDPTVAGSIIASITFAHGSKNATTNPTAPATAHTATTSIVPVGPTMTTTPSFPLTTPPFPMNTPSFPLTTSDPPTT